ncbi:PstS family phosphate ABC transporter substrate-binding protein [Sphaerisporangium perillae]|uniref:PstS family phosphate ABC transporter substrate-binding protein n=1 Tax=Sphaerisporangium perillae TaxID=2935860 RepID=UPI00200C4DA8|nr:substrate-binding domain-containing protein [Sphaerisporangium perillae]
MAGVLDGLARLVTFLGGAGPVVLSIALLVAAPFVDRLVVRRKRLVFRVLYNSKIGVGPEVLHDGTDAVASAPPQLRQVARLLDRMSMVVIRIRNGGSYDIDPDDFDKPLSFTFGGRVVWNARVSEASTPELRAELRESLRFFPAEGSRPARDNLLTVRRRLTERLTRWLAPQTGQDVVEPAWQGVRIDGLSLKKGQKAKLVVVLREPGVGEGEITKLVRHSGKLKDAGLIKDEKEKRRLTLPRVSGGLAGVLTVVLVLSLMSRPTDATVVCASGDLRVEGSSVFLPAIRAIAEEYRKACGDGARITTEPNGSLEGVRSVAESDPAEAAGLIALSDGRSDDAGSGLQAYKIAVVVYHVVVNSRVELTTLSIEDLRKINDGRYTDWNQVPGGGKASLPIRIVGRGQNSGTRQLFERRVLGAGESLLSSNSCLEKDRNAAAPVIRCERDDNAEIVQKISTIPGAIGYADALSIAEARRANSVTALTLDGKAFDPSTADRSGYPFWTVEYLYFKGDLEPGSLRASFIEFVRRHARAQARLNESGFEPCTTSQTVRELCDLR